MIGDKKMKNSKKTSLAVKIIAGVALLALVLGMLAGAVVAVMQ